VFRLDWVALKESDTDVIIKLDELDSRLTELAEELKDRGDNAGNNGG